MGDEASGARRAFTYDVVGYHGGELGIALATRNTVEALRASGRDARLVTVGRPAVANPGRVPRAAGTHGITLFEMNPLDIAALGRQWSGAVEPDAPAACVPFWELPRLPNSWRPVLGAMQAILAPTRFIEAACRASLPGALVLHYPQAVFLPASVRPSRVEWGIAEGATAFLVAFDVGSDIDRKNPWAAVSAFQAAFPVGKAQVELILKVTPREHLPGYREQLAELRRRIGSDPRIRILDRWLGYEEVLGLYASCDAMVALHRSEGLGLHLMEAMSLGKPVVATGWSGNMDFMDPGNSVPVACSLVPVASRHVAYREEAGREGQVWAEPDPREAAEALRALHASPERRDALGAAAARTMDARRADMRNGQVFDELERVLGTDRVRAGRLRRAAARSLAHLVWRKARSLANRGTR